MPPLLLLVDDAPEVIDIGLGQIARVRCGGLECFLVGDSFHIAIPGAQEGIGAILHTINPRLSDDQIVWVANHAEDSFLFFDNTFAAQVAELKARMPLVKRLVAMTDPAKLPAETPPDALVYEDLIAANSEVFEWPELDEKQASGLCYTSVWPIPR